MIDAQALLDSSITGSNSTSLAPIPVGEYVAIIEDVEIKPWQGRQDPTRSGQKLICKLMIDDEAVRTELGRDKVTAVYEIMLDLNDSGTGLDMGKGKNVQLGRLREAVGLNDPSQPFGFRMLTGRPLRVQIEHEMYENEPRSRVKRVTKA